MVTRAVPALGFVSLCTNSAVRLVPLAHLLPDSLMTQPLMMPSKFVRWNSLLHLPFFVPVPGSRPLSVARSFRLPLPEPARYSATTSSLASATLFIR